MAYHYLGNYQQSLEDYRKSVSLDAKNSYVYYNYALTYCQLKDKSKAIENITKAIELNKDFREKAKNDVELSYIASEIKALTE